MEKKKKGGPQPGSGRPKKVINEEQLYKLAQTLLPMETIASVLDCSVDTLEDRFSGILRRGRSNRKTTLSQVMWDKALVEKDTKMMIWLSKQHLGYREVMPEEVANNSITINIREIP